MLRIVQTIPKECMLPGRMSGSRLEKFCFVVNQHSFRASFNEPNPVPHLGEKTRLTDFEETEYTKVSDKFLK